MSRKNVILPFKFLDAHPLNASFDSRVINVQYQDNVGIQLSVTTNANTGLFSILTSIDGVIWDTLTLSPAISALAGANKIITVALNQLPFTYIKVHFEIGTGTNGTVTGYVTSKEI